MSLAAGRFGGNDEDERTPDPGHRPGHDVEPGHAVRRGGRPRGVEQIELPQIYPQAGWVEHDAETIWADVETCCRRLIERAGADNIVAIGITNQRETTVLWDRASGKPVAHAIVWQDRRTAATCAALQAEGLEEHVRETTGLILDPYFSGTKLAWLLDNIPGARARAAKGELAFEPSTASCCGG